MYLQDLLKSSPASAPQLSSKWCFVDCKYKVGYSIYLTGVKLNQPPLHSLFIFLAKVFLWMNLFGTVIGFINIVSKYQETVSNILISTFAVSISKFIQLVVE